MFSITLVCSSECLLLYDTIKKKEVGMIDGRGGQHRITLGFEDLQNIYFFFPASFYLVLVLFISISLRSFYFSNVLVSL